MVAPVEAATRRRLRVELLTRGYGGEVTGLSRYDQALIGRLRAAPDVELSVGAPRPLPLPGSGFVKRCVGLDAATFFEVYPVRPLRGRADLLHLTHLSHASALWWPPARPVVVTVHDIIHYVHRRDARLSTYAHPVQRWFDERATRQLRRATLLLASSAATRDDLVRELGIPAERIQVVPLGVDQNVFRSRAVSDEFRARHGLAADRPYVLHVSTEEPRKNLPTLLRAWRDVVARCPEAVLVKVGAPRYPRERSRMLEQIAALGLGSSVRIVDAVSNDDLVSFYNTATCFAFPSLAEGFGFPVLEAMACGTPVVCSDIPPLAELGGPAALRVPPSDAGALAAALLRILERTGERARLTCAGHAQARCFTWERTAERTREAYREAAGHAASKIGAPS